MYVSDYGYSAVPSNWTIRLDDYNLAKDDNWMFMGMGEWTITRDPSDTALVFLLFSKGDVLSGFLNSSRVVCPVFYLNTIVNYNGGNGSYSEPYRVMV